MTITTKGALVTWRIMDNVNTHGITFTLRHEAKRLRRKGYSAHVANTMAFQLVRSTIAYASEQ